MGKIIESYGVDDWEVLTDDGWVDIQQIHKTIKYDVWKVKTKNHFLKCADEHIVIDKDYNEVYVKDLKRGDRIITESGAEKVISVKKLKCNSENMYDMSIDSDTHTYFTNGILSHNTTISTVYLLHYMLFNKDKNVAILANKKDTALEIMQRVKMAFGLLPLWLQQGIKEGGWNKSSIRFENGMVMKASTTSSDSISGDVVSLLYMDEFAKVKPHIAEEFITATYPVITSGKTSKIIMVSTPLGMNHFYEFWTNAVRGPERDGNNFYPIKVSWKEHPKRDQEWKDEILRDIGPTRFNQEFGCKFLGSSDTLIDGDVLENIAYKPSVATKWGGLFTIFEKPVEKALYVLGVDSAKGTGRDSSVIQVLRIIDEFSIEQVAIYRYNNIDTHKFSQVCIGISKYYNNAYMMIENNGEGGEVANIIWYEYEEECVLNCDKKGLGIRSTKKSKLSANLHLKRYLENGWLRLNDKETVVELSKYIEVTPNVFRGETRTTHDDCVTSLLWGLYFLLTPFFDGKDVGVKNIDSKYDLGDDDAPLVFFS